MSAAGHGDVSTAGSTDHAASAATDVLSKRSDDDIALNVVESALAAPSTSSVVTEVGEVGTGGVGENDIGVQPSSAMGRALHHGSGSRVRLEGVRHSARECRIRKKLRYQYVEQMVSSRERAILALRHQLETYKRLCSELDEGRIPPALANIVRSSSTDKHDK